MYSWEETINWEELKAKGTIAIDRAFYENCAAQKLHEQFPEYESRIAVGLVGEGSDIFGFDDEISRDHDFDIGFCMWLNAQDYAAVGAKLQTFYMNLMNTEGKLFARYAFGREVTLASDHIDGRRGAMEIYRFYGGILRLNFDKDKFFKQKYWIYAEPRFLATVTNGEVFRDDLGQFTEMRNEILNFYPERSRLIKLAEQMHLFSHGGQSNYPRMMARKDYVAVHQCIDQTITCAMNIAYLLDKKYPPYYKWTHRGLSRLSILPELSGLLEELVLLPLQKEAWENYTYSAIRVNTNDAVIRKIEEIAALLVKEMNRKGLVSTKEPFLESHVQGLVARAQRS